MRYYLNKRDTKDRVWVHGADLTRKLKMGWHTWCEVFDESCSVLFPEAVTRINILHFLGLRRRRRVALLVYFVPLFSPMWNGQSPCSCSLCLLRRGCRQPCAISVMSPPASFHLWNSGMRYVFPTIVKVWRMWSISHDTNVVILCQFCRNMAV